MRHRWLVIVLLCVPLAGLLGTLATSRLYWGHWLGPPSSDKTARHLSSLHQFTRFWYGTDPACGPEALAQAARSSNHVSGDSPYGRLAEAIVGRGLSPENSECLPASLLVEITNALRQSNRLFESGRFRGGEDDATELYGALAAGVSPTGSRMILAALTSSEVSDDHYPYYELALVQAPSGSLQIVESRFYWYDVAGLEGGAHLLGGIVAALGALVVGAIAGIIRVVAKHARFAA